MARKPEHADDAELDLLLASDDEASDAFRSAASHVESCETCRRRLETKLAPGRFDDETRRMLSAYPWDELWRSRSAARGLAGARDASPILDFLSPPSHPEMLGRLGRYEIERVIGSGGMGVVLKAFDTELNRPVAIKVLARHLAHRGAARQRFAREAKAAAAVVHEHVVAIHNVDAERDHPFLVMQFVAGESLQARVDRDGPLDAREILRIGIQAAAGLAAAHEQGVVHRDVKPANILLETGVERVLLTDFGLARTVDDASLTHTGVVAGTPHYMSPEQANGEASDYRTDLFSLGAVLYFMSTGHPPFRAERAMGVLHRICHDRHRPVHEVNADIPPALSRVIDRLLEKKPSRRFADAADVKETLAQALADIQQYGMRRRGRVARAIRCHPVLAAAAAFAALAAAVVAGWIAWPRAADPSTGPAPERVAAPDAATGSDPSRTQRELLSQESAALSAAARDVAQRLDRLEAAAHAGHFAPPDGDHFWEQAASIDARLERLESGPGTESSTSSIGER